jgi:hypothetical protein
MILTQCFQGETEALIKGMKKVNEQIRGWNSTQRQIPPDQITPLHSRWVELCEPSRVWGARNEETEAKRQTYPLAGDGLHCSSPGQVSSASAPHAKVSQFGRLLAEPGEVLSVWAHTGLSCLLHNEVTCRACQHLILLACFKFSILKFYCIFIFVLT